MEYFIVYIPTKYSNHGTYHSITRNCIHRSLDLALL